jgi:hypothetical protein
VKTTQISGDGYNIDYFLLTLNFFVIYHNGPFVYRTWLYSEEQHITQYRGADKSLAQPGRKQARKHAKEHDCTVKSNTLHDTGVLISP